jgi:hypothetical protein
MKTLTKIISLVFVGTLFVPGIPFSAKGAEVWQGQEVRPSQGITDGQYQVLGKSFPIWQSSAAITGLDRWRLKLSERVPGLLQRAIHRNVQHRQQTKYLAFMLGKIDDPKLTKSALAGQLRSQGSEVHQAYLRYVQTRPSNTRSFVKYQTEFVMSMLRYIKENYPAYSEAQRENLMFYVKLVTDMKAMKAISIASWDRFSTEDIEKSVKVFKVPSQLLKQGYRGSLGAVTDMLRGSKYQVTPRVLSMFLREHIRRLFSQAS